MSPLDSSELHHALIIFPNTFLIKLEQNAQFCWAICLSNWADAMLFITGKIRCFLHRLWDLQGFYLLLGRWLLTERLLRLTVVG